MSVVICGDVVHPEFCSPKALSMLDDNFGSLPKIVNLEGAISGSFGRQLTSGVGLSSHHSVLPFMRDLNVKAACLANNHYFDYEMDITGQRALLDSEGISSLGGGESLQQASLPFVLDAEKVVVLNFGWKTIGCISAEVNSAGVNPYRYDWVLKQVRKRLAEYPGYRLLCVFHWNYEFEQYPQPADRRFVRHLIDEGVSGVFGHHAHIIQGFEYYKNRPIFYGLGNFFFPDGLHGGVDIKFPPATKMGLSVEFGNDCVTAHITELVDNQYLKLIYSGAPEHCETLREVSQFATMRDAEYLEFFREHRAKRKLLPIYKNFDNRFEVWRNDKFVQLRQVPLDIACRLRGNRRY